MIKHVPAYDLHARYNDNRKKTQADNMPQQICTVRIFFHFHPSDMLKCVFQIVKNAVYAGINDFSALFSRSSSGISDASNRRLVNEF